MSVYHRTSPRVGRDAPETPTLADVCAAARRTAPHLHRTPLLGSRSLSQICGCQIHLKCENLQKTGSFKPRGGLNRLATLDEESRERGVITISAGNHAQGVAYAASRLGVPAVVVMPANASAPKVAATRGYGAECVLHGDVHGAFEKLHEIQQERSLTLIHPFDDAMLIAGHGTVGWEIFQQLPSVETIICGIGGGGLISGIATAIAALAPEVRIVGVEPEGAATMTRALEAGEVVRIDDLDTIADGLAPPFVGELNLRIVSHRVDAVVTVSDDAIRKAMRLLLERAKVVVEPAGAAALAAIREGQISLGSGEVVAVVLSGGNLDIDGLGSLIGSAAG